MQHAGMGADSDVALELGRRGDSGGGIDAIIVTDVAAPQRSYDLVVAEAAQLGIHRDRVLAPALLRISTNRAEEVRATA